MENSITEKIYENQGLINRICYSFCSDEDDRKDLFQEIVYRILKSYKGFKNRSSFSTWLYRVALNTAITYKRKKRPVSYNSEQVERLDPREDDRDIKSEVETLYRAIDRLNKIDKAIILLYLEEHSYKKIAEITGFTENNISVRLVRIKAKLTSIYNSLS